MTFEKWLETYYQYRGANIEEQILYQNRRLVDELFEEECLSYQSAERQVIRMFEEEYIADSISKGFVRLTERFWWEEPVKESPSLQEAV